MDPLVPGVFRDQRRGLLTPHRSHEPDAVPRPLIHRLVLISEQQSGSNPFPRLFQVVTNTGQVLLFVRNSENLERRHAGCPC